MEPRVRTGGVSRTPLVVIVGETASGKTDLALRLARRFRGEIIAADSRTFYRGMDVGTAKPTLAERGDIVHHLIDIADPGEQITVADFKRLAGAAIEDIARRNKLPIMVGGSGLYVDAFIFNYDLSTKANPRLRAQLVELTVDELQEVLRQKGIPLPVNARNHRHLVRQLETDGRKGGSHGLRPDCIVLGMRIGREELRNRVNARTDKMFEAGLVDEVEHLMKKYGSDCPALRTIGYQELIPYFGGEIPLERAKADIVRATMQYAKRQRTWFRRNKSIHYICCEEEAVDLITTFLNNQRTV